MAENVARMVDNRMLTRNWCGNLKEKNLEDLKVKGIIIFKLILTHSLPAI